MSSSKRTISFTVRTEEHKKLYEKMAEAAGYIKLSDLARVAFVQYIRRYKLYGRIAVQRDATESELSILQEYENDAH